MHIIVEKVQLEILETPVTVYNFEVEDFHTYYVSDTNVLVHNMCKPAANITNHGEFRINGRSLTQREYDLIKATKNIKTQAGGAKVYIRAINNNKYNIIVENNAGEIITYIKDVTKHGLKNLAKNYGGY